MATEEEAYLLTTSEQLLDKAPISTAIVPNTEVITNPETMEPKERMFNE